MSAKLYTIGHSTHPVDDSTHPEDAPRSFIGLLNKHGITAVCDVRSHPYSKHNPQYNREAIADKMKSHGIAYIFLGKELGARSNNPSCYVDGKIQFQKLAADPLFQAGLARLRRGVKKYTIALMCAEKDPIACHRAILITRQLQQEFFINHILASGELESNEEMEKRLMELWKIEPCPSENEHQSELPGIEPRPREDENQRIERAYKLQEEKIAYQKTPKVKSSQIESDQPDLFKSDQQTSKTRVA